MTESFAPWWIPLVVSVGVMAGSGALVWWVVRGELGLSVAVVSVAAQLVIMAVWVLAGVAG